MSGKRFAGVALGRYDVIGIVVVAVLAAVLVVATLADGGTARLEETLGIAVATVAGVGIGQRWRRRRDQQRANAREHASADDEGESRVDAMLPYVAMTISGVFFVRAGLQTHGAWLWIQLVIGVAMVIVAAWSAAAWWRERDEDWW
jgi:hypothetical protein